MTRGADAERRVTQGLRAALTDGYELYENVQWTGPVRRNGPARDGEADLVIAHPDRGVLVVEVKSGAPSRDHEGRWHIGDHKLTTSPFEQARTSQHVLHDKLVDLPSWPAGLDPLTGHAVAFPDVDLASLPRGHALLGPDAPTALVLDATALDSSESTHRWLDGAFDYWTGDGAGRKGPPEARGMALLDELLRPTVSLRRLVRGRIADDRAELISASLAQSRILNHARSMRRVEVIGPAGSGKSLLAAEKARTLAAEGYRTLLVCFNQRLATTLGRDLADAKAPAGLTVTTFHRLCERLGTAAGALPTRPSPIPPEWWDETLPRALDAAIDADPDTRFHAIVIDEGQDFARGWLDSLELLLLQQDDVFWVFHDPAQALFRPDVVGDLGLVRLELYEDHRNPPDVARLASRFRAGDSEVDSLRQDGLPARIVEAEPGRETVEAVRRVLHELTHDEQVPTFGIAVLSGRSATDSDVWKQRRFGNAILWNEAIDDQGASRGLAPEDIPDEPDDVVLFETIRRFKGLEREVVVLVELPEEGERLNQLLYVGLTRATTHLVVIAPASLTERLRGG